MTNKPYIFIINLQRTNTPQRKDMVMSLVEIKNLKEGQIVAENVYTRNGQLILHKDTCLTRQMISRLAYYKILKISILEGEIPQVTQDSIDLKNQVEQSHVAKLLASSEFQIFKKTYAHNIKVLEQNFNDIILKNTSINELSLITDTISLFEQNPITYSLLGMLHVMKQIDDSTYAHSVNVAILCRLIGTWMNFSKEDLDVLTTAGLLHDIGKCQIPDDILLKPGKLTSQEYEFIKMHPLFGHNIVKNQSIDERVKAAVLGHHERYDGTGYPSALKDVEIDDFTSIVSIADVYDAMTATRCYRQSLCPFEVIATFEAEGLNRYNPKYVYTFLEHIVSSYVNSDVLLSNNQKGRIILANKQLTRPVVQLENNEFIDLEEHTDIYIQTII